MTRLQLRLDQPDLQESLEAGAVATVRWLADPAGGTAERWWQERKPINLFAEGSGPGGYATFELPGGGYYAIEVAVPRGEELTREVRVEEGETVQTTLTLKTSPHEYLGWQQFAGIIPARPPQPVVPLAELTDERIAQLRDAAATAEEREAVSAVTGEIERRGLKRAVSSLGDKLAATVGIDSLISQNITAITRVHPGAQTPALAILRLLVGNLLGELRGVTGEAAGGPEAEASPLADVSRLRSAARRQAFSLQARAEQAPPEVLPRLLPIRLPESWQAWSLVEAAARRSGGLLAAAGEPLDFQYAWDADYVTWFPAMPDSGEAYGLGERLRGGPPAPDPLAERFPRWVAVVRDGRLDLASIPWAWWIERSSAQEEIRILYDRRTPSAVDHDEPGRTVVGVQDRKWFSLLEFLSSGRLFEAATIAERVVGDERHEGEDGGPEMALYGKLKGPIVAVAGAVILLARTTSAEPKRWDHWLENLANWFPGIPDGPILLAYRRLQTARTERGLGEALGLLKEGMERGLPFMSATLRVLDLSLARLGSDLPEADALRRRVAAVAGRVDPGQPFTVIRLPVEP